MIKVLLTGANGQVGHEIKRTVPDDVTLFSYDKQSLDITSIDAIKTVFTECRPDYVINAAAYTAVDRAEQEPELAYNINAKGAEHLACACREAHAPLIHLSTDYVFDGLHDEPYVEKDSVFPLNVYGKSKWEGEQAVRLQMPQHIILRTSWIFSSFGNNFVKTILRLAKDQSQLRIVSDQYGCPTAAKEVALTVWQIIKQIQDLTDLPWGTYHFANKPHVSWYDFAKKILDIAEKYTTLTVKDMVAIKTSDYPILTKRPAYSVLSCQKITDIFQIRPSHWEEALDEVVRSLLFSSASI